MRHSTLRVSRLEEVATSSNQADGAAIESSIEITGVSHYFLALSGSNRRSVVEAIRNINLSIKPGEFVALVGPSGCGKTTVLNLLSGLLKLQAGSISILGSPPAAARPDTAYMFARDALLPWRTARQNVELGLEAVTGLRGRAAAERAIEMLVSVGLRDFQNAYPAQLSHGMRQRVALARTFALPSQVLLMDEPFAALDSHLRIQTGDLLLDLWERDRRSVVFVTHDLHEAIALADRVIVFQPRPGRIKLELHIPFARPRSVAELQENREYHELYRHLWHAMGAGSNREVERK